jgi:hypothetical protein
MSQASWQIASTVAALTCMVCVAALRQMGRLPL